MASFEIRSAAAILLVFVFVAAYQVEKSAGATTYVVGDSIGWTIPAGGAGSYASWASGHTFMPGDDLVFNFPTGVHDVAKVDKASFDSCSASNPTTLDTVGPATITLRTAGPQFFICTFGKHCSLGQKLTLIVSGASTSPPAPSPSPNATVSTPPPTPAAAPPKATPSTPSSSPPTAVAAAPKATPSTPSPSPPTAATPKGATPSTPSSSPPTAAAPKAATPSTSSSSPPTAAAPEAATPSTTTTPAKSPAVTPSSATPPSTSSISPTIAPASTSGGPGGPEVPSSALSPGGSGPGGVIAPGPGLGPSGSTPQSSGSATKIDAVSTLLGLIVAIAGGIAFVGY